MVHIAGQGKQTLPSFFFKSPATAIMSLAMPIVMMGMIGGNIMQNMAGGVNFEFGQFMLVVMFNPFVNFVAIVALTVVCLMVGTYFFAQSEKNR